MERIAGHQPVPGSGPLTVMAEASELARALILVLNQEVDALAGVGGVIPAGLVEAKASLTEAYARVLERLREMPERSADARAWRELQSLDAQVRVAARDNTAALTLAMQPQGPLSESDLKALGALIEAHPDWLELRYRRAGALVGLGRDEEAHRDYLAVLTKDPAHYGTLNDFGNLLLETGFMSAARTAYLQAMKVQPERPEGYVNLANLLLSQIQYQEAKVHYLKALALDPTQVEAHRGLSYALAGLGDEAGAASHREPGFRGHAVLTWPHRGPGTAVPVIVLTSATGGNIPLKHILAHPPFHATVIFTEYFDPATPLPPHRLIVNTIGDADQCRQGLDAAETLLARAAAPVINPPAAVRPTGRMDNARRLAALPGVVTPRVALLSRALLTTHEALGLLADQGIGFPLLLRSPGFHTGQYFVRVESPDELATAAADLPGRDLLVMQVLDARDARGYSHKYRVMFVDGVLYPLHLAISKHWKVHYFSADMADQPAHREQEAAFLNDMPSVLGAKAMAGLESIRQTLGLDYGGMDFAVGADGDVLLFEANATMVVYRPSAEEKWAYRRIAAERILEAIRTMVISRAMDGCGEA